MRARVAACIGRLENLKKTAGQLRSEHLRQCLVDAREREDDKAVAAIHQIICKERHQKRWRNVKRTVKGDNGGAIGHLKVPSESAPVVHATKDGVDRQAASTLKKRFRIAMHASILQDQRLLNNFGYL